MAGGIVTNTGNALAVPDWPTTFGHHMFLFPWSQMVGGVLIEHGHRLLGSAVGLLTLVLGAVAWRDPGARGVRGLALAAVLLVGVQGLVGGLRVVLVRDALAMVHGCLAQAFFALTVTLAVATGRVWRAGPRVSRADPGLPGLATAVAGAVYGQAVLGAVATHAGWLWGHVAGAGIVTVAVTALAGRILGGSRPDVVLAWWARTLVVLAGVQLTLGTGAYLLRVAPAVLPGAWTVAVALPVLHRAGGACLLGAAVALALHAWQRHGQRAAAAPPAAPDALVNTGLTA